MFSQCISATFSELTTPAAPFNGGFAAFFLMARPPLLFQEGNTRFLMLFLSTKSRKRRFFRMAEFCPKAKGRAPCGARPDC
jgi:hypothetical protein